MHDFTKEHIVPLSKGGGNQPSNKKPCCKHCNRKRGNKSYEYWLAELEETLSKCNKHKNSSYHRKIEAMIENVKYWQDYVDRRGQSLMCNAKEPAIPDENAIKLRRCQRNVSCVVWDTRNNYI